MNTAEKLTSLLTDEELPLKYPPTKRFHYYYSPIHAVWLLPLLDKLIELKDKNAVLESVKFGMRPNSLMARVSQAWQFIIDNADTEKKYYFLRAKSSIKKTKDGVVIKTNKNSADVNADIVSEEDTPIQLDILLEEYIRSDDTLFTLAKNISDVKAATDTCLGILGPSGNEFQWIVTTAGIKARKL